MAYPVTRSHGLDSGQCILATSPGWAATAATAGKMIVEHVGSTPVPDVPHGSASWALDISKVPSGTGMASAPR